MTISLFNRKNRGLSLLSFCLECAALILVLAAAGSKSNSLLAQDATETVDAPIQTAGERGRVLVWVGGGASAETKPAPTTSELGYLDARGTWQKVMDLPRSFAGVYPCGDRATSPDGRRFSFIVHEQSGGLDGGLVYQITDAGQAVQVGRVHALTCVGGDPFQYSPDSSRLVYLNFNYNDTRSSVSGTLRVLNADTLEAVGEYASAAGFYLTNDEVFFTQYYASDSGAIDEVAVMRAPTSGSDTAASEITTLFASTNCNITSSQVTSVFGKLAVLVAENCGSGRQWQLYTLNRDGGAVQPLGNVSGSTFYTTARTNWLVPSWDDRTLIFSVPEGTLRYTAEVFGLSLAATSMESRTELVSGQVHFPTYVYNRLPAPDTSFPRFSPDGRYWAMIQVRPGVSTLYVIDRAQPDRVFTLLSSAQPIPQLFFSPDSQTLYATVGNLNGAGNQLQRWDLTALSSAPAASATEEPRAQDENFIEGTLVASGNYGRTVIYPDGRAAAAVIWRQGTDRNQTMYQTLARISLDDGSVIQPLLVSDMLVVNDNNSVARQRFVYPLAALTTSATAEATPTAP